MPSFDVATKVDLAEVKNAVSQFHKEMQNRFDFKGTYWELKEEKESLIIDAEDDFKLGTLRDMICSKLAKRNVSLKNLDYGKVEISSVGKARQVIKFKMGFETEVAKKVTQLVKAKNPKLQAQIQEQKVRVTGKNRDDLQEIIQHLRQSDLPVSVEFENFRE
jgi:hypothetical protein